LDTSRRVLELNRIYPGFVFPTIGVHPERLNPSRKEIYEVKRLIQEAGRGIVGIGEVGIPYYSVRGSPDASAKMEAAGLTLAEFASLSRSRNLAIVVHAPHEAATYALKVLKEARVRRALFHWHKASDDVTKEIVDEGYYVSVTPEVCYEERDQKLVRSIPLSSLVVETDGPWRYGGEFAGSVTEPTILRRVIAKVAALRNEPVDDVPEKLVDNTSRLFGLRF